MPAWSRAEEAAAQNELPRIDIGSWAERERGLLAHALSSQANPGAATGAAISAAVGADSTTWIVCGYAEVAVIRDGRVLSTVEMPNPTIVDQACDGGARFLVKSRRRLVAITVRTPDPARSHRAVDVSVLEDRPGRRTLDARFAHSGAPTIWALSAAPASDGLDAADARLELVEVDGYPEPGAVGGTFPTGIEDDGGFFRLELCTDDEGTMHFGIGNPRVGSGEGVIHTCSLPESREGLVNGPSIVSFGMSQPIPARLGTHFELYVDGHAGAQAIVATPGAEGLANVTRYSLSTGLVIWNRPFMGLGFSTPKGFGRELEIHRGPGGDGSVFVSGDQGASFVELGLSDGVSR